MTKPYKSYREMVGHWACDTPEIEVGAMDIIDANPDYVRPCTNKVDNGTQKVPHLEEGQPFQVNLDSAQMIAHNIQYAFITWHFNISRWLIKTYYPICAGHTPSQVHSLYQWLTPRNVRDMLRHHHSLLNTRRNRGKRDTLSTILGGIGAGMGVINQADISVLRAKLAAIASNSKRGFEAQREVNDVINNLQQSHVNTNIGVANDFIQQFKGLSELMASRGKNISWAVACTQGQVELSTNIKLAIQSLYDGQWPFELLSKAMDVLPEPLTFTHSKWWANSWIGCINNNFETCYASSLIPYTSFHLEVMYKVTSIGILTGKSTLLHPRLDHPYVIREDGQWKQVDISLCIQKNQDILCTPGQYRVVEDKCWRNASVCVLDGESITKGRTPVLYLGHQRVCFFILNTTDVTLITDQCSIVTSVNRGAWCTLGNVTEIRTPEWKYVIPSTTNLSIDLKYHTPVDLRAINLGIGRELQNWLIKFDRDEELLRKLEQEGADATILIHHDKKELKQVTRLLESNAKGYWWHNNNRMGMPFTTKLGCISHYAMLLQAMLKEEDICWLFMGLTSLAGNLQKEVVSGLRGSSGDFAEQARHQQENGGYCNKWLISLCFKTKLTCLQSSSRKYEDVVKISNNKLIQEISKHIIEEMLKGGGSQMASPDIQNALG
ncbi:uncharacterized protein [Dendropsophus ebraccatus]|uniref:uncharacterized protein n=1 Tax=Dendropsophus ebraccatus TaxID=150705 RepID=UPI003831EABA